MPIAHRFIIFFLTIFMVGCIHEPSVSAAKVLERMAGGNETEAQQVRLIFKLPTSNVTLFHKNGETNYFMPTGHLKSWSSGSFGCVRNNGQRMHEGVDIRPLKHNSKGEPLDIVRATADGTLVFFNAHANASSYGKYIVLIHKEQGLELYSLYAHLSVIAGTLKLGALINAGEPLGVMGRTANHNIPAKRSHLHFEIGLVGSYDFKTWVAKHYKDPNFNKFGLWHGYNLLGLNPAEILTKQKELNEGFSIADHIAARPALMQIHIKGNNLPLAKRLSALIETKKPEKQKATVGYGIDLNINGTPLRIYKLEKWVGGVRNRYFLASVDEKVALKNRCRQLVFKSGAKWILTNNGHRLAELLAMGAEN